MSDKVDQIIEQYPDVWKTRSAFFSYIKGVIRKGWNTCPQKVKLIKKLRKQIDNPNPRGNKATVWGATCEICGKDFVLKDLQVDHRSDETAKLTEIGHVQSCVEKLLMVVEDDLRLICKDCHGAHTLAQKEGISFEDALIEKQLVIPFKKLSAKAKRDKLKEHGVKSDKMSVQLCVDLYRQIMKEMVENEDNQQT